MAEVKNVTAYGTSIVSGGVAAIVDTTFLTAATVQIWQDLFDYLGI